MIPTLNPFKLQQFILKECLYHFVLIIEEIYDFYIKLHNTELYKIKSKNYQEWQPLKITYFNIADVLPFLYLCTYIYGQKIFFDRNEIML